MKRQARRTASFTVTGGIGQTLGPLSQERYTSWIYKGHLAVLHHEQRGPHVCAVFNLDGLPVWFCNLTEAGLAILTAAGVR